MKKIKVIIVDDSILVQKMLISILNNDPDIVVAGVAENPNIARELIKILSPDVLLLDVEMPEMDGLTFLEKIMRLHPMPVIMCSSFTPHCREVTLEAFKLGVVDIVSKPLTQASVSEIISKVKNAAQINMKKCDPVPVAQTAVLEHEANPQKLSDYVFTIGASTGGTEALKALFMSLPKNVPPILVTQHLPEDFCTLFADRANQQSDLNIAVAKQGEQLKPGHVYIAPGGKHLEIERKGHHYYIKLTRTETDCEHIPSVDVMMKSVASIMHNKSTAILLTGMGTDGAKGMLEIQNAGGITIAQDENSSVVWGMPRAAVEIGAANYVLPLQDIAKKMLNSFDKFSH